MNITTTVTASAGVLALVGPFVLPEAYWPAGMAFCGIVLGVALARRGHHTPTKPGTVSVLDTDGVRAPRYYTGELREVA